MQKATQRNKNSKKEVSREVPASKRQKTQINSKLRASPRISSSQFRNYLQKITPQKRCQK
jgi:hypothetical protein